jgi:transcriptional regulator with XRE-family HTH domain
MRDRIILGHKLRSLREEAGLRPGELAAEAGCSKGHLRNIEGSGDQPSGPLAYRFVRALNQHLNREINLDDFAYDIDASLAGAA